MIKFIIALKSGKKIDFNLNNTLSNAVNIVKSSLKNNRILHASDETNFIAIRVHEIAYINLTNIKDNEFELSDDSMVIKVYTNDEIIDYNIPKSMYTINLQRDLINAISSSILVLDMNEDNVCIFNSMYIEAINIVEDN